jgi:hypothetical protein
VTRIFWLVALLVIAAPAVRTAHADTVEKDGDVYLTYDADAQDSLGGSGGRLL